MTSFTEQELEAKLSLR